MKVQVGLNCTPAFGSTRVEFEEKRRAMLTYLITTGRAFDCIMY